jgi:hypothetical protein
MTLQERNGLSAARAAVERVIDRSYETLPAEEHDAPGWEQYVELFADRAVLALRLFPRDPHVLVMNLEEYRRAHFGEGVELDTHSEVPGQRSVEIIGDVATVRQPLTFQFATQGHLEAVDQFTLARRDGVWKIVSVISDFPDRLRAR